MEKLKMHSKDLSQDNLAKIQAAFPNCVTERKNAQGQIELAIDFDLLRQELSANIVEGPQERYRLDWPGKREAMLTANAPIAKTLRPAREESVNFDDTENLFIEGDNLDALKLLQETYLGKVKMIYIDPPYNTGKDFVYEDDFAESTEEFLQRSNQKDEQGNRLVSNPESSGRFHSDWLSMMLPRLRLARNLLTEDGVVFISIDDNEQAGLKKLCDEIFGDKNFIGTISWSKKRKGSFLSKKIVSLHEYLLVYGKTENVKLFGGKADANESQPLIKRTNNKSTLTFPENTVQTKMGDRVLKAGFYGEGSSSVELHEDLTIRDGLILTGFKLTAPFVWSQTFLNNQISNGAKVVINTENLQVRVFKAEDEDSFKGLSSIINGVSQQATNEDGYEQLKEIFKLDNIIDYPKPINLIKNIIQAQTFWERDSYILDFFAGSATTAHAVMQFNAEDGGNRKFIMVQLPEAVDEKHEAYKAGYKTIAEISKERIRRAGAQILEGDCHEDWSKDIGFRVLKVDTSNMQDVYYQPQQLDQKDLFASVDNIKPDRSSEDLLFQVLLDWGVDLTLPIRRESIQGKDVFIVDDNALVACFEQGISEALIHELAALNPLRAVFRDNGFASDAVKVNVTQIFKQRSPITEVKAL